MKQKMIFYGLLIFLIAGFSACEKNEDIEITDTQKKTLDTNEFIAELPLFVTETQAKEVGINFLNLSKYSSVVGQYNVQDIEEFLTVKNDMNEPILYVMNLVYNRGFVVLSASTVEKPILAYSYAGNFDVGNIESYDGLNDWAAMKFVRINYLLSNLGGVDSEIDSEVANQWVVLKPNLDVQIASEPGIYTFLDVITHSFGAAESATSNQGILDGSNDYTTSDFNFNTVADEHQESRVVYINGCSQSKLGSTATGPKSFGWGITTESAPEMNCYELAARRTRKMRIKYRVRSGSYFATFPDYLYIDWIASGNNNGWYDYEDWNDVKHANYSGLYLYSQYIVSSLNAE